MLLPMVRSSPMKRIPACALLCMALLPTGATAQIDLADLYSADAIVTGRGEESRQAGFENCLREVLVRVSGDPRLAYRPRLSRQVSHAGDLVAGFRYHDRMLGIPVHDDQGTYDRPYDLHCSFNREKVDRLLAEIGSRPWLAPRPRLTVVLLVEDASRRFALASDGTENPLMTEALLAEAASLALEIAVPDRAMLAGAGLDRPVDPDSPAAAAKHISAGSQALAGRLAWKDEERIWEADWRLPHQGRIVRWQVRAPTFDAAFRNGLAGAAQVLSGNGQPQ